MALSANEFTYAGGPQVFPVNFSLGYIDQSDVFVQINDTVDGGTGDPVWAPYTFFDAATILVSDPLTVGDKVSIRRIVSKTELNTDFTAGDDVTPQNLDNQAKQGIMIYQELLDGFVGNSSPADDADRAVQAALESELARDAAEIAQAAAELAEAGAEADRILAQTSASEALASEIAAASDLLLTNADVVATNADVVQTNADVLLLDAAVLATAADVVSTNADAVATGLDADATAADVITTAASAVQSGLEADDSAASAALASLWAEQADNTDVDGVGTRSAKHWAGVAQNGAAGFPSGGIVMWSGTIATIPLGWSLCDGTNSTPNLVDRFIMGAGGTKAPADVGGQNVITDVPAHTHGVGNLAVSNVGDHEHSTTVNVSNGVFSASGGNASAADNGKSTHISTPAGAHGHTLSGSSGETGLTEVNIQPYFYALAYIMKD